MKSTKLKNGVLHIECEGCMVNIKEGLFDSEGRKVTTVSIIPDNQIPDLPVWHLLGQAHNRLVQYKDLKVIDQDYREFNNWEERKHYREVIQSES